MDDKIKQLVSSYKDDVIKDIQTLVQVKSIRDVENKTENAVFGPGIREALEVFCKMCEGYNMETYIDPEGSYAYAEIGPKTATEMIGIVGHLDTVPEGDVNQWTVAKPFSGDVVDDCVVGRGTLDDKGPVVLNIHAVKALLDLDVTLTKRVRIIVGGAEETTWEGIRKYIEKEELPTCSYSPDAEFPLIYAEKSILNGNVIGSPTSEFKIIANGAYNAVNDYAQYIGPNCEKLAEILTSNGLKAEVSGETLNVYGKSAHSMECYKGTNAVINLCVALTETGVKHDLVNYLATEIGTNAIDTKVFGYREDGESGELTTNIGLCLIDESQSYFGIDMRIPVLLKAEELKTILEDSVKANELTFEATKIEPSLYVERDSKLVKSLVSSYQKVSKDTETKPIAIGGGTYARAFDNCVAFGPMFINVEMDAKLHQPNEKYEIKYMQPAIEIYVHALISLLGE